MGVIKMANGQVARSVLLKAHPHHVASVSTQPELLAIKHSAKLNGDRHLARHMQKAHDSKITGKHLQGAEQAPSVRDNLLIAKRVEHHNAIKQITGKNSHSW